MTIHTDYIALQFTIIAAGSVSAADGVMSVSTNQGTTYVTNDEVISAYNCQAANYCTNNC